MSRKFAFLFLVLFLSGGLCVAAEDTVNTDAGIQSILDQYEVAAAVSLIPAEGFAGWTTHFGKPADKTRWKNEGGKFLLGNKGGKNYDHVNNDLVTAKPYSNYILDFSWITKEEKCNSGVKYRLSDFGDLGKKINYGLYPLLGPEYQIGDDGTNPNDAGKNKRRESCAAVYAIIAPHSDRILHPLGEVNHGRIVVLDKHIEHWLNNMKVLEYDVDSEEWNKLLSASRYKDAKGYAAGPEGYILLQDHGYGIIFEKITIREIGAKK